MLNTKEPKLSFFKREMLGEDVTVNFIDLKHVTDFPCQGTYFEVPAGCSTPVDQHLVKEIWIVLKGNGILNYDGQSLSIVENDILYFAPNKSHQLTNSSHQTMLICSFYW